MTRVLPFGRGDGVTSTSDQIVIVEEWAFRTRLTVLASVTRVGELLSACDAGCAEIVGVTGLARLAHSVGMLSDTLHRLGLAGVDVAVVPPEDERALVYQPGSLELAESSELAAGLRRARS